MDIRFIVVTLVKFESMGGCKERQEQQRREEAECDGMVGSMSSLQESHQEQKTAAKADLCTVNTA